MISAGWGTLLPTSPAVCGAKPGGEGPSPRVSPFVLPFAHPRSCSRGAVRSLRRQTEVSPAPTAAPHPRGRPPPPSGVEVSGMLLCSCTIGITQARTGGPKESPRLTQARAGGRGPARLGFPVLCNRMRWPCSCHVHFSVFAWDRKKGTKQGRGEVGRVLTGRSWSPEPTCSPRGLPDIELVTLSPHGASGLDTEGTRGSQGHRDAV